jgi:4a-hydroxytetrahydrobiopterin dehydratase
MKALSKIEITEFLSAKLKKWSFDGTYIKRDFKFKTFVEAFSFMSAVALEAEKIDHHPDWSNVYNSVSINLNTHSAKGITKLDFDLAATIDSVFEKYT